MSSAQHSALRIGLTGGIASGKSAVAELFAELGAAVIDTDLVAREVVAPGQPGLAEVTAAFGPDILRADGTLDRAELRSRVFADPAARQQLEGILHPLIRAETLAQADACAVSSPYQILVVPLLVETGFSELTDRVLVVDCPPELQQARVMARDKASAEEAQAMIRAQATREERLAAADDVVVNDGSLDALRTQVEELHQRYLRLAEA